MRKPKTVLMESLATLASCCSLEQSQLFRLHTMSWMFCKWLGWAVPVKCYHVGRQLVIIAIAIFIVN